MTRAVSAGRLRALGALLAGDRRVFEAAWQSNFNRLRLLAPVVVVINALHVLLFLSQLEGTPQRSWKLELLLAHGGMAMLMAVLALFTALSPAEARAPRGRLLAPVVAGASLAFAIVLVAIDQQVTSAISPFLVACMIVSLVFYLPPRVAGTLAVLAYAAFFVAMGLVQADPDKLLSNRLNGASACILGFALAVLQWRNFTIIRLQQGELEKLARTDSLTGLLNRAAFEDLAERELTRAEREGGDAALLVLDLDHFKRVNDEWGHAAGDAVLRHVAVVMQARLRCSDLIGRLGGEEFVVLLPHTSLEGACVLAESLRRGFDEHPAPWQTGNIAQTASIGAAVSGPGRRVGFDALYREADRLLYRAKLGGRNRVEV